MDAENLHFTYNPEPDNTILKQGDVLEKTPQLNSLLQKYHSHYTSPVYTHFQILTQSCDLVKRRSSCSARYITIAAVRSFDTVIQRTIISETGKNIELDGKRFCNDKGKDRLAFVVETILNNNAKEFFYLHNAPKNKLENDSTTFLHLSITIKAEEHYELCLKAKILELKENFRAKLGWMVGNLYSRVGTEDFVPGAIESRPEFLSYIDDVLDKYIGWVPAIAYSEFKKTAQDNTELTIHEIYSIIENKINEKKNKKIESYVYQLMIEANLSQIQVQSIKDFLSSDRGSKYLC